MVETASKETELNNIEDCIDLKSDASTNKGNKVDLNKGWDSYQDTNQSGELMKNSNVVNADNYDINCIEEQKVEVIIEEVIIEEDIPESNLTSIPRKSFKEGHLMSGR